MKIMVFTPYLPHRRVGHGGGVAVRDLIIWLAKKHDLMVVALIRPGEAALVAEVRELGVEVLGIPFADSSVSGLNKIAFFSQRLAAFFRSLRSGYPLYVEKYNRKDLTDVVAKAVQEFQPDAIQIEYLQLSLWARALRQQWSLTDHKWPRLILNTHELGSLPRQRRAARATNFLARSLAQQEAAAWQRLQVDASFWVDTTLCVTPEDQQLFAEMGGRNLVTVPLGMDLSEIRPDWQPGSQDGRETYLFVGSFGHRPNLLAAELLLEVIWPVFRRARPGATLILAGRGSDTFLTQRRTPAAQKEQKIEALGFVDDLAPHFRNCRLFVAPLSEGGGIKIKILEALARGVPVVTTAIGAEGIAHESAEILTISSCDATFAEAMLAEVNDLAKSQRKAAAGRQLMASSFSWEAIAEQLAKIYATPS